MPAESSPAAERRTPPSVPTVPLFPLGPWLWSSFAVMCWLLLAVTGLGLLFFFVPTPEGARASLVELREATGFDFLRSLHYWASHALVIAAWLHGMRVFVVGSYRRTLGWTVTVVLVVLVLAEAWTGSLLPAGASPSVYAWHVLLLPILTLVAVQVWRSRRVARASVDPDPEAPEPDAVDPEAPEPDATDPEAPEPDAPEPETSDPEAADTEATEDDR